MKTALSLCFALLAFAPAHAQIFRPEAVNGALLGGIAGAIIGNNSGDLRHNSWKGAAIGAGAGLLIGSAIGDAREDRAWRGTQITPPQVYVQRHAPIVYRGYGHGYNYGYGYHRGYPYRSNYGYRGYYSHYSHRPDYRGSGLFWGGVTGAIIGHNSGSLRHNAWRGAAWGAGLGYIVGSIAENNARYREAAIDRAPIVVQAAPQPAPAAQPQQVTIINNYYNTPGPMTSANGLFGRN